MSANVIEITDDNFETEVVQADQTVIVDFWAEWCGPCKMMAPILDELATELGDQIKIGKINVDLHRGVPQRFQIQAIPTMLFFKGGEVVERVVGVESKASLVSKLEALN